MANVEIRDAADFDLPAVLRIYAESGIDGGESHKSVVKRHKFCRPLLTNNRSFIQRHLLCSGPTLCEVMSSRVIDQNVPHHLGRDRIEVPSIVPLGVLLT